MFFKHSIQEKKIKAEITTRKSLVRHKPCNVRNSNNSFHVQLEQPEDTETGLTKCGSLMYTCTRAV